MSVQLRLKLKIISSCDVIRMSDDKNEYNLFYGKWGTEYSFEIFASKTPIQAECKLKNQFLRAHFSPYQWFS